MDILECLHQAQYDEYYVTLVILGEKITSIANTLCFLPILVIEGEADFQFKISKK